MTVQRYAGHPLFAAIVLIVLACSAYAQTAGVTPTTPPPATVPASPEVELAKALGWPIAALVIAGIFFQPISRFVSAIGSRITKLSIFKVEVELLPATAAVSTPLLDDIRTATSSADINDSSRMMLEQVQSGGPADFAVVALGAGEEWITSRLYIAAVMMERMRGLQALVFVERSPSSERKLVAVASARQVRWALARRYPWLEAALARASLFVFPAEIPAAAAALPPGASWLPDPGKVAVPQPVIVSDSGGLQPFQARQIVSSFIDSLQIKGPPTAPMKEGEWVQLGTGTVFERGVYVTRELLSSLLPPSAFTAWTNALRDAPRSQRTRAVLRRQADFVAMVEGEDREFTRLTNRRALLEEIATALGEEPEGSPG